MEEWKILKQEIIKLEGNNFIEISLKKHPKTNENLIGLSKGWIRDDDKKMYKSNILFNLDQKEKIIEILSKIN